MLILRYSNFRINTAFQPHHDKTNKMSVRPAKTQISLGIRPVWSETSLCAQWVAKDPRFLHAESEASDQTGRMPRLIWVFAGRKAILFVLSCRGSFVQVSMFSDFYGSARPVLEAAQFKVQLTVLNVVPRNSVPVRYCWLWNMDAVYLGWVLVSVIIFSFFTFGLLAEIINSRWATLMIIRKVKI